MHGATNGIGYNEAMVRAALPEVRLDSWSLIFEPAMASKLAKCGIGLVDSPVDVTRALLLYLGRNANSQDPADLRDVKAALLKIRRYVRHIDSSDYIEALANGELCIALGYNGDLLQARDRAREAHNGVEIRFIVPKEGSILSFDMLAIPKDAPHPQEALAFINYMMDPQVIAKVTNLRRFANGNRASLPYLSAAVRDDPAIYPGVDIRRRLTLILPDAPEQTRAINRLWQEFKSAQ